MSSYGEELRAKLLPIFDTLAEQRCCEHGIHNSALANEEALKSMQDVINEEWLVASKAARANSK